MAETGAVEGEHLRGRQRQNVRLSSRGADQDGNAVALGEGKIMDARMRRVLLLVMSAKQRRPPAELWEWLFREFVR